MQQFATASGEHSGGLRPHISYQGFATGLH